MFSENPEIPLQPVDLSLFFPEKALPQLHILRTDLTDSAISGNKWYKLKYNLLEAQRKKLPVLTFGGAFSNHIAATAAAGKKMNIRTIGIIRGEEHLPLNATLQQAVDDGMQLFYLSRTEYRNKYSPEVMEKLHNRFGKFMMVPEGGSNRLALKGVREMLPSDSERFHYIVLASGTGGTTGGLFVAKHPQQTLLSVPVLKNAVWMPAEIAKLTGKPLNNTIRFLYDYHFGGYAKISAVLVDFVNDFYTQTRVPLDVIYTGKAMFAVFDLMQSGFFTSGDTILFIHTGGLQGNEGMKQQKNIHLTY
jgi:1-aminocyclopropane-1-carboxylate deaminase/D-cysteine desulfhydrase-like pyridoxal-dependent ACC family enzyme